MRHEEWLKGSKDTLLYLLDMGHMNAFKRTEHFVRVSHTLLCYQSFSRALPTF